MLVYQRVSILQSSSEKAILVGITDHGMEYPIFQTNPNDDFMGL
jgi:hypothetical protein